MWLGQVAWDLGGAGGLREAEGFSDKSAGNRKLDGNFQAISRRGGMCLLGQQPAPPGVATGEEAPGERAGRGGACGLTELERWATALMCSSSSKMSSSSSSVRCPGLQAREDQKAKDELRPGPGRGPLTHKAQARGQPMPPQGLLSPMASHSQVHTVCQTRD